MTASPSMDLPTVCDDMLRSPVPGIAFEVEISDSGAGSPQSVPKRVRRRLLETAENKSRSPASLEEIEAKLKDADSRRQQFHEWLANKARPKVKSPPRSSQPDNLAERLRSKLIAAEQKRLELLAQEQTRLARSQELRAAARTEVQLRAEREREELESRVESRVHQAETNRLALLEAEKQRRAAVHERIAQSILQRTTQEGKDKERVEALRALICQKIAAAEEKRASLLKAERTRAQALVLQARRVAKAVRRKRELESRNKKELLEARLQRAKRRRAEYLGQKGGCQGACHNNRHRMKKHGDRLCRKLTRCWRQFLCSRRTTLMLARDFAACNINQQTVTSLPFEELAARITSPNTLRSVKALLARLESRFLLSSASNSNVAKIDHLLKRLSPPNKKTGSSGNGGRINRRSHSQRLAKGCSQVVNEGSGKDAGKIQNSTTAGKTTESQKSGNKEMDRYPPRVFLCAYMVIGHPEAVFSTQGEREVALSKAARKLVPEFEALVSTILDGPPSTSTTGPSSPNSAGGKKANWDAGSSSVRPFAVQLAEFDAAWCSYLYQFVAWKVQDAQLLEEDLIRVACQLELSMLQKCTWISDDTDNAGADASHDSQAIQKQVLEDQQLLRERVLHLTGSAGVARMEEALSKARNQFSEARERGSPPPSPFASPQKSKVCTPAPLAATETFNLEPKEATSGANLAKSLLSTFDQSMEIETSSVQHAVFTPPLGTTHDDKAAENERLVNEMLHEPNWSISDAFEVRNKTSGKLGQIQAHIKTTIEDAFWNGVLEGLSKQPPEYEWIIGLLKEMKTELEGLVPESWKQELNESLDIELFTQVLESGSHDYEYFRKLLDYSLRIVLKLGAPARDSDTKESHEGLIKELTQISSEMDGSSQNAFGLTLVKGLRFVLEQIRVLKADMSAARILALTPIIQGSAGVEYLQKAFVKQYELPGLETYEQVDCREKLPKTVKWLGAVNQTVEQEKEELESLRAAYWSSASEKEASRGLPPTSSMRTGGRVVLGKPSSVPIGSMTVTSGSEEHTVLQWRSVRTFVALGLLQIISDVQPTTEYTVAETLRLNVHRMRKAQNDYQRIVILTTGLLLLRQHVAGRGLIGIELEEFLKTGREQLDNMLDHPEVTVTQIGDLLGKLSTSVGEGSASDVSASSDLMTRVLNRSLSPDDVVFKRVSRAVKSGLKAVILVGKGTEGLALVNSALQQIGATCLQELVVELGSFLSRIASVSCSVHGPFYASIIASMPCLE